MQKKYSNKKSADLGFLSILFGSLSFLFLIFTGIPAIIIGIIALIKKSGNQAQAKIGIALGIIAPAVAVAAAFGLVFLFSKIFPAQFNVPDAEREAIAQYELSIEQFTDQYQRLPSCQEGDTIDTCADWIVVRENLESEEYKNVEFTFATITTLGSKNYSQIVYANQTTCLFTQPISPEAFNDEIDKKFDPDNIDNYAALIYFYSDDNQACFPVKI